MDYPTDRAEDDRNSKFLSEIYLTRLLKTKVSFTSLCFLGSFHSYVCFVYDINLSLSTMNFRTNDTVLNTCKVYCLLFGIMPDYYSASLLPNVLGSKNLVVENLLKIFPIQEEQ